MDLISSLSNWFGLLINRITTIGQSIVETFNYILSIFKAIWYGITSLVSGLWNLIIEILDGELFFNISRMFDGLSTFIGGPAVVFIATLLFIVFLRIFIAFIFKIFRLNIDYHALNKKLKKYNK